MGRSKHQSRTQRREYDPLAATRAIQIEATNSERSGEIPGLDAPLKVHEEGIGMYSSSYRSV